MKSSLGYQLFALTVLVWLAQFLLGGWLFSLGLFTLTVFWCLSNSASMRGVFGYFVLMFGGIAFVALDSQCRYLGAHFVAVAGALFAAIYFAAHGAALFLVFKALSCWVARWRALWRHLLLAVCFTVWAWWLTRCSLWPLGHWEGIYLLHPLAFLIDLRLVRVLLGACGDLCALALMSLLVSFCVQLLYQRRWHACAVVVVASVFFEVCYVPAPPPVWLKAVGVVAPPFCPFSDKSSFALIEDLDTCLGGKKFKEKCLLVFPETTFPRLANTEFLEARLAQLSSDNRMILMGVYRTYPSRDDGEDLVRNAAAAFWRRQCNGYYDKSHRVVFAEWFPLFIERVLSFCGVHVSSFGVGDGAAHPFLTPMKQCCIPLMCSELFFTKRLLHIALTNKDFVCALINDGWFVGTPIPRMMLGAARLQAAWSGKSVLYASYQYQGFISSAGQWLWL
ncbi:MAG: hypothetical protein UV79_C0003G0014 [candidate division TM6 bacterium GW2011_GWF2_43_17]|nr:MAG: hypothetical protein UV79_C0003G0014 [candidate division TM6 bacterium GW2011_GWF2_43_17]HAU30413.1 hypothetical protein [Candidatus Dependentiae bacterium]